jgi:AraC-like DNA-binding protein
MLDADRRATPRDDTALFVHRAANAFQRLAMALVPRNAHVDPLGIARDLPEPTNPFQVAFLKYLAYEATCASLQAGGRDRLALETAIALLHDVNVWPATTSPGSRIAALFNALSRAIHADEGLSVDDQFVEYIERFYSQHLTVRAIATHFETTPRRLNEIAVRRVGMPVREYVRAVRVRRGLALVSDGTKVEAAALAVGYRSKKDFYRAVRQLTGLTPGRTTRNL